MDWGISDVFDQKILSVKVLGVTVEMKESNEINLATGISWNNKDPINAIKDLINCHFVKYQIYPISKTITIVINSKFKVCNIGWK